MSPATVLARLRADLTRDHVFPLTDRSNARRGPASRPQLVELPVVRRRARPQSRALVLEDTLFRSALIRERKRADRTNQPFVVLLLALDEGGRADASLQTSAVDALAAVKGETDVLGWFSERGALGVIFPEVVSPDASFVGRLEAHVRQELARRLDADRASRLSIRTYVHAGLMDAAHTGHVPIDPLLALHRRGGRSRGYETLKRALDVITSALLLVMLSPLLLAIAALVKLTSRGPVLFTQVRVGQAATRFSMLKFRTMHFGTDYGIHSDFVTKFIKSSGPQASGRDLFKITDDPRVTPVGRMLRKTSLDELPQLWNVLRGEMSLVGPRPPLPYEVEQYQPWHCRRVFEAKPGMTGLWQVKGRSRTTFDEMVRLDLRYARTRSFWTDLKILLATPSAVIAGRGAY
jgi:lipopolysaccharide/colanic/teichoic acid biosynthesis glycosyltransferase